MCCQVWSVQCYDVLEGLKTPTSFDVCVCKNCQYVKDSP